MTSDQLMEAANRLRQRIIDTAPEMFEELLNVKAQLKEAKAELASRCGCRFEPSELHDVRIEECAFHLAREEQWARQIAVICGESGKP